MNYCVKIYWRIATFKYVTFSKECKRRNRCRACDVTVLRECCSCELQEDEGNVLFNDALNTFYLQLYGVRHMVRSTQIAREETRCHHMGYSFWLAARVLLYAPSHRQDSTYHGICYTSCGALAGTRNSSMGSPWRIDPTTHHTMSKRSTSELRPAPRHEGSIRQPIAPWSIALTTEKLHLAPAS